MSHSDVLTDDDEELDMSEPGESFSPESADAMRHRLATFLLPRLPSAHEASSAASASSRPAGSRDVPERERSRSRDSDHQLVEAILAPEDSEPEAPRTCSCPCYRLRARNLGPRGNQGRRCACPLCGHSGCHRRIRVARGTPANALVICQDCGPLCIHFLLRFGVPSNRARANRHVRSTSSGPPPRRDLGGSH